MGNAIVQSATIQLKDQGGGVFGSVTPVTENGITSVTGTIADGQTVNINGGGFGADGPANYMFEDFSLGTDGQDATLLTTNFDSLHVSYPPIFTSDARRPGGMAARMFRESKDTPGAYAACIGVYTGMAGANSVFSCYSIRVPTGKYIAGANGGNSGTNADYPTSASWKTNWWIGVNSFSTNDLISISLIPNGRWVTGGNSFGNLDDFGTDPTWWKWNKWHRILQWAKPGAIPQTDPGILYTQIANGEEAITEFNATPVIFGNGAPPYNFQEYHINGWNDPSGSNNADVRSDYADLYHAWGGNECARVELGDASTYAACTDLAICEAADVNWANSSIEITVRQGGLDFAANTWLFVTLPDNTTRYSYQVVTV